LVYFFIFLFNSSIYESFSFILFNKLLFFLFSSNKDNSNSWILFKWLLIILLWLLFFIVLLCCIYCEISLSYLFLVCFNNLSFLFNSTFKEVISFYKLVTSISFCEKTILSLDYFIFCFFDKLFNVSVFSLFSVFKFLIISVFLNISFFSLLISSYCSFLSICSVMFTKKFPDSIKIKN
jgi:hypothetical protein